MDVSASSRIAVVLIIILPLSSLMGCLKEMPASEQEVTVGYKVVSNETVYEETQPESWICPDNDCFTIKFNRTFKASIGEVFRMSISISSDWTYNFNKTPATTNGSLKILKTAGEPGSQMMYQYNLTSNRTNGEAPRWDNISWYNEDITRIMNMKKSEAEDFISNFNGSRMVKDWELDIEYNEDYRSPITRPAFTGGRINWTVKVDIALHEPVMIG